MTTGYGPSPQTSGSGSSSWYARAVPSETYKYPYPGESTCSNRASGETAAAPAGGPNAAAVSAETKATRKDIHGFAPTVRFTRRLPSEMFGTLFLGAQAASF